MFEALFDSVRSDGVGNETKIICLNMLNYYDGSPKGPNDPVLVHHSSRIRTGTGFPIKKWLG